MVVRSWSTFKKERLDTERAERIARRVDAELLELNLQKLREFIGVTQAEVAEKAQMTQGELSRTERREDHLVSTLRRYVRALGGELKVVARFGDKEIRLTGV